MVLVSQIYAPLEFDRTLYVFCCNTRVCSLTSEGWVVVRNQESRKAKESASAAPAASAWSDFLTPTETESKPTGKVASAWGDFSFDEEGADSSVDALTALLEERDLLLTDKPVEKKATSTSKSTSTALTQRYTTTHQLPCWEVSELEESWALVDEEAAWEGLSADDEAVQGGGADSEHINRLLKSYFEGEEDTEIVNMVKKQQISGAQKGTVLPDTDEETDKKKGKEKALTTKPAVHKQPPPGRVQKNDSDEDEGSEGEGNETGLSRSSRRQQAEAYFQRRVSFYPTQVLRYAYGGAPLWISHPSPLDVSAPPPVLVSSVGVTTASNKGSADGLGTAATAGDTEEETVFQLAATKKNKKNKAAPGASAKQASGEASGPASRIPRCEGCGQARVFECQLMPALLSYISTSSSSNSKDTSSEKPTTSGVKHSAAPALVASAGTNVTAAWSLDNPPSAADIQRFQECLGQGLDFGVVAIYSCPDSCENSREFAVVQGPPDIL